jgi:arylsulfatase A-like enzyme
LPGYPTGGPPAFNEADVSDKPSWIRALPLLTPSKIATEDANHRTQLESLQAVDRALAGIVDALGTAGRLDQTIFIFASDNGFAWGEHRLGRGKECVYEECMRVPIWIRVPGLADRHEPSLVELLDLAPTIAEWAGLTPPSPVNGLSLKSLLTDGTTSSRSELLFEYFGNDTTTALDQRFTAVRTSQYVYAEYENGETELYDLLADPYEMQNLVTDPAYAATVAQLKALLDLLRNS